MPNASHEMTSQLANDGEPNDTIPSDARPAGRVSRVAAPGGFGGPRARQPCGLARGHASETEESATDAVEQTPDAASEATDNRQKAAGEMMDHAAGTLLSVARPTGRASSVTVR